MSPFRFLLATGVSPFVRAATDTPLSLPLFDAHRHDNREPVPHLPLEQVLALFRNDERLFRR